jgi:protein-S-isoprenylcysteine O-methyltransferase Ste14
MRLNAPKNVTWWIAVVVGVLGILGSFTSLPLVSDNYFWFVVVGFVLLALATLLKGL